MAGWSENQPVSANPEKPDAPNQEAHHPICILSIKEKGVTNKS